MTLQIYNILSPYYFLLVKFFRIRLKMDMYVRNNHFDIILFSFVLENTEVLNYHSQKILFMVRS